MNAACCGGQVGGEGGGELVPVEEQEAVLRAAGSAGRARPGGGSAISVFTDSPLSGANAAM